VTPATIEELLVLQSRLLEALLPLLAPAGWLVYATCTVEPRENRGRIEALLQSHPGWQLVQEQQWWPGLHSGDGFYAAVLQAPATSAKEGLKAAVGH
jgi:16S rRNA (cytosine967-C5)-methyltransferase